MPSKPHPSPFVQRMKPFNLNLPVGSDIKWVESDIQISVGSEVDIGATVNTSDKNITIELQKAVGNNIVLINGLKVSVLGIESVDLKMNNTASETIGLIQNKIKVGSTTVTTQKDTNIVWMRSVRSNLLPEIQIIDTNIALLDPNFKLSINDSNDGSSLFSIDTSLASQIQVWGDNLISSVVEVTSANSFTISVSNSPQYNSLTIKNIPVITDLSVYDQNFTELQSLPGQYLSISIDDVYNPNNYTNSSELIFLKPSLSFLCIKLFATPIRRREEMMTTTKS